MSGQTESILQLVLPHQALVRVLLLSERYGIPPSTLIDPLSYEFKGKAGRRLRQISNLLSQGVPVLTALERTRGSINPTAFMALQLAQTPEDFQAMLASLIEDPVQAARSRIERSSSPKGQIFQVVIGLIGAWLMISFLMIFIIPTFEKMFEEFGIDLPASMELLISISRYSGELFVLAILVFFLFSWMGRWASGHWWWASSDQRSKFTKVDLMSLLAIMMQYERPLEDNFAILAKHHPDAKQRKRLKQSAQLLKTDRDLWQGLQSQSLINVRERTVLQTASTVPLKGSTSPRELGKPQRETLIWLLRRMAMSRKRRRQLHAELGIRLISFACLLVLASVVLLAAVSVFMSLYNLVAGLA